MRFQASSASAAATANRAVHQLVTDQSQHDLRRSSKIRLLRLGANGHRRIAPITTAPADVVAAEADRRARIHLSIFLSTKADETYEASSAIAIALEYQYFEY